jgi:hypothetical protein
MTTTAQRIVSSCFVLSVAAAGLAIPTHAQAQYGQQRQSGQQRAVEGSHMWGQDGWCYVVSGGRWVRTSYYRVFPDRTNTTVFDIYQNGRFVQRVGGSVSVPTQASAGTRQLSSAELQLLTLMSQLNAAMARPQASAPRTRAAAGCESIPMYKPLTQAQKNCNDAMVAAIVQSGMNVCEQRRAAYPYDANGNVAEGWVDTITGVRMKVCRW